VANITRWTPDESKIGRYKRGLMSNIRREIKRAKAG